MRRTSVFVALSVTMLVACGASEPTESGGTAAASRSALASLPATVIGNLDIGAGGGGNLEDGTVMSYGSLQVGDENFQVQANADMLESSGIAEGSTRVRTTISSKTSERDGEIQYTIVSLDKL